MAANARASTMALAAGIWAACTAGVLKSPAQPSINENGNAEPMVTARTAAALPVSRSTAGMARKPIRMTCERGACILATRCSWSAGSPIQAFTPSPSTR